MDDETGPREALRMVLKSYFRVFTAEGGRQALDILAEEKVDVVTLDLRMPEMDGVATLERIRAIDPTIGIVVVTGFGSKETLADTIYLGAFSYLNKPFHVTEILETVREACDARHSSLS